MRKDMKKLKEESEYWGSLGTLQEMMGGMQVRIWDDMTGRELDWNAVLVARMEEIEEFRKRKVYEKVPLKQCMDRAGKAPIKARWVGINKG
jgi:hypothetical protein